MTNNTRRVLWVIGMVAGVIAVYLALWYLGPQL